MASVTFSVAVLGTTTALANHDANVVHTCQRAQTGGPRLVTSASECQPNETAVAWNKQGPAGPAGGSGAA